ncbi:MAG: ATP diphosphatase [Flavobacteriales bacterium]|jgi:ATP diphosphatase
MSKRYTLEDLSYLMSRLRKPETGCPWDLDQNYRSIVPSTIEEVFEVVDAIESQNYEHLKEELGDLLFQIVFYAQLADEESRFDLFDIIDQLTAKLLRRHPHVFPDGTLQSERTELDVPDHDSIGLRWEATKEAERGARGKVGLMDDIPLSIPTLKRAQKLQKRAARVGFDWDDSGSVLNALAAETLEYHEAKASGDAAAVEDEIGDMLFCLVNLARKEGIDADQALRGASRKFEQRMRMTEKHVGLDTREWVDYSTSELDVLWQRVKVELLKSS